MNKINTLILSFLLAFTFSSFAATDVVLSDDANNIYEGKVITVTFPISKYSPQKYPDGVIQASIGDVSKHVKFQENGSPVTLTYTVTKKDIKNGFIRANVFYIKGVNVMRDRVISSFVKVLTVPSTESQKQEFEKDMLKSVEVNNSSRQHFKEKSYRNKSEASSFSNSKSK